jgi:hypothetical protein
MHNSDLFFTPQFCRPDEAQASACSTTIHRHLPAPVISVILKMNTR